MQPKKEKGNNMNQEEKNHPLLQAMKALHDMPKIDIKGRPYTTIANRVEVYRKFFPDASITTEIVLNDEQVVVVKATVSNNGIVVATGHGEEIKGAGLVNSTSALENCETSAIGRALASCSLHGGEFASFEEVSHALHQQNTVSQNIENRPMSTTINDYGASQLKAVGLDIKNNGNEIVIIGNSYGHQGLLKSLKYRWRPENKQWYQPVQEAA